MELRSIDELTNMFARAGDPFGFARTTIAPYLPYEAVAHLVGDTEEQWETAAKPYTLEDVHAHAGQYLRYAWHVALAHRNIESQRSLIRMFTYRWILGGPYTDMFAGTHGLFGVTGLADVAEFLEMNVPPVVLLEYADSPVGRPVTAVDEARLARMLNNEPCTLLCKGCTWKKPENPDA